MGGTHTLCHQLLTVSVLSQQRDFALEWSSSFTFSLTESGSFPTLSSNQFTQEQAPWGGLRSQPQGTLTGASHSSPRNQVAKVMRLKASSVPGSSAVGQIPFQECPDIYCPGRGQELIQEQKLRKQLLEKGKGQSPCSKIKQGALDSKASVPKSCMRFLFHPILAWLYLVAEK